jgi:hypothetical protein
MEPSADTRTIEAIGDLFGAFTSAELVLTRIGERGAGVLERYGFSRDRLLALQAEIEDFRHAADVACTCESTDASAPDGQDGRRDGQLNPQRDAPRPA